LKTRILVVEDNLASRQLLMEFLSGQECETLSASDGGAALEAARAFRPHVVLLDIQLPVMDGLAVLSAMRRDPQLRHARIIAVTAYAMQGDREELLRKGFDGYVGKPVDFDVLLNEIGKVLKEERR